MITFEQAFKYPFNRAKGMLNILWVLLPIIGWFALGGYSIRIVKEFIKGKFKQLPLFNFKEDLKLGFFMFFKAIPFMIVFMIVMTLLSLTNVIVGVIIRTLIEIFIIPILFIHFFNKETVASLFEFKILNSVFNNIGDYIMVVLKSILLGLIFFIMIIVLVGIPASSFTKNIFLADFYKRNVKV